MVIQYESVQTLWMMDLTMMEEGMSPSELLPVVIQYEGMQTPWMMDLTRMEEGVSPSELLLVVVQYEGVQTPWMIDLTRMEEGVSPSELLGRPVRGRANSMDDRSDRDGGRRVSKRAVSCGRPARGHWSGCADSMDECPVECK